MPKHKVYANGTKFNDRRIHEYGPLMKYFTSGLAFWFLGFFLIFFVIGGIWTLIEHVGLLESSLPYSSSLDDINIIIGFIFHMWITNSMNGYLSGPTNFRVLLNNILSFSHTLFDFLYSRKTNFTKSTVRQKKEKQELFYNEIVNEICKQSELLKSLIFYSGKLFIRETYSRGETVFPYEYLDEYELLNNRSFRTIDSRMLEIISESRRSLKRLEEDGLLNTSETMYLFKQFKPIIDSLNQIDVSNSIRSPNLFLNHTKVVLGVFFMVYLPYRLVIRAGLITLIVYPIVLTLLSGFVIIRRYLKDPFDPKRPWVLNSFDTWCDFYTGKLENISHSDDLKHELKQKYYPEDTANDYNELFDMGS